MKKDGTNYILKYQGDVTNENTPSVIQIMITQVFGFGDYKSQGENVEPVLLSSNEQQYGVGMALLLIVLVLVPIMLCTKPIIAGCSTHDDHDDDDEIEFTNINRDDMSTSSARNLEQSF